MSFSIFSCTNSKERVKEELTMNVLLMEMDGPDCLADDSVRVLEAETSGYSHREGGYYRHLYDANLLACDEPVTGGREFLEYLVREKWRVILLTKRYRSRPVYHATLAWLKQHDFDDFDYDLVLKEHHYGHLSVAEWKVLKACWYAREPESAYKRIVLIEPHSIFCRLIQKQWNAVPDQLPLELYAGITEFSTHLAMLGPKAKKALDLLAQHEVSDDIQVQEVITPEMLQAEVEALFTNGQEGSELLLLSRPSIPATNNISSVPFPSFASKATNDNETRESLHKQSHEDHAFQQQEGAQQRSVELPIEEKEDEARPSEEESERSLVDRDYDHEDVLIELENDDQSPSLPLRPQKARIGEKHQRDDLLDDEEHPASRKKPAKRTKRERQARRALKATALIE